MWRDLFILFGTILAAIALGVPVSAKIILSEVIEIGEDGRLRTQDGDVFRLWSSTITDVPKLRAFMVGRTIYCESVTQSDFDCYIATRDQTKPRMETMIRALVWLPELNLIKLTCDRGTVVTTEFSLFPGFGPGQYGCIDGQVSFPVGQMGNGSFDDLKLLVQRITNRLGGMQTP